MDDLAAFLRARYDEIDPKDFHDRYQCDLGTLQFFGDCSCKVPELVRRDIEAKRRIIDRCEHDLRSYAGTGAEAATAYLVLRLLAAPYAGHHHYRKEWKP